MTDEDISTTRTNIPAYRITIKEDTERVDLMEVAVGMMLGSSQFMCSNCGDTVTVSKKKAAKLKKRKRVTILCKKCKKAIKARRRRK